MNKRPELDFWTSVFTNADSADTPEGSMEECQNLRPLPGKLVKTYGAGYLQDSSANVCPITVATGYSVINIFCYINDNLPDDKAYIALVQKIASKQVWVLQFDSDYNVASDEPSYLLPFGADSFWVNGVTQTFNTHGKVMLTNVSVLDVNSLTYTFPITAPFHMPQDVEDTNTAGTMAYKTMPTELGIGFYRKDDSPVSYFADIIGFDNEIIKTFTDGASVDGIVRFQRASGVLFAITTCKSSDLYPDKLWWYYGGAWAEITTTDFSDAIAAQDTLNLLNITELDGSLYLTFRHYDFSDGGSQYHYRLSRLTDIATSPTWVNDIVGVNAASEVATTITTIPQDSVTTAKHTDVDNYFILCINGTDADPACPGYLYKVNKSSAVAITKPTFPDDGHTRIVTGVATANDTLFMSVNNTTDGTIELRMAPNPLAPTWQDVALPATVSGFGTVDAWVSTNLIRSIIYDPLTGVDSSFCFVALLTQSAANYYVLVKYDASSGTFLAHASYKFASATYAVQSLYDSSHEGRTGGYILSNVVEIAGSKNCYVYISDETLSSTLFYTGQVTRYIPALFSYEKVLTSDWITTVSFLMGEYLLLSASDPVIYRVVSFGANPDYSEYPANFVYHASFRACMGWVELFQGLDVDLEIDLFHKADRNPIVMDSGILRFLPGAVGSVGANEAKGLWYGYIDRDYYDGLVSIDGLRAYDKTPLPPAKATQDDVAVSIIAFVGIGGGAVETYLRYSYVYDGIEESFLSEAYTADLLAAVDKAVFRLRLYDGTETNPRSSARITAIRIYEMDGTSSLATGELITEISLTLPTTRNNYSVTGYANKYVLINEAVSPAPVGENTGVISGVGAGGVGEIEVTSSTVHGLEAGDFVTQAGTTDYNGQYEIQSVIDTYRYVVNDTFVSNQTGTWGQYDYFAHTSGGADYQTIESVTTLDVGYLLKLHADYAGAESIDGPWYLSHQGTVGTQYDFNATSNGSYGPNIIIDPNVDFTELSVLNLTVCSSSTAGIVGHVGDASNNLEITSVKEHAVLVSSVSNALSSFKYDINAHPYVFYLSGGSYYLTSILDFSLNDGSAYALTGSPSIKVNPDFSSIMAGRLFSLTNVLDPGGENEDQSASLCYSEVGQYDVTPVSNLIKFNDREGGGGTGLEEIYGRPVVAFKQGLSLMRVSDPDPANWTIAESPHNIGNIAKQGMVSALGTVYVCYYDGIYGLTANNLAETDSTPTERLKITTKIEDKYLALYQSQKEAIVGEYDQSKNEILWQLGAEQWAYSTNDQSWREIVQYRTGVTPTTIDIITIDENADLMFYDEGDGAVRSFTKPAAVASLMKSKVYNIATERDELLRYMWVFNPYSDAMTITPYMDGVALSTTVVAASTAKQKIVIKKRGLNFQVQVSWASSTNDNQLLRVVLEYDN
jgi:hypothetical protein